MPLDKGGTDMRALLAIGILLTSVSGGSAQSAEETALFIMYANDDPTYVKQVKRLDDCRYVSVVAEAGTSEHWDFTNLQDYEILRTQPLHVKITGKNLLTRKDKDGKTTVSDFLEWQASSKPPSTPARLTRAVEYFRKTFCKGRAF
jgi:hypothetical protein